MAAVAIALTALGAISSYRAGQKAQSAAEENARRIKSETEEQARRQKKVAEAKTSEARARARASGVRAGGSQDLYIGEMESEFGRELDWLRASGAGKAQSALRQGEIAKSQGTMQAIGGLANVFGMGAKYYNWGG